jgi:hypothetical protein
LFLQTAESAFSSLSTPALETTVEDGDKRRSIGAKSVSVKRNVNERAIAADAQKS